MPVILWEQSEQLGGQAAAFPVAGTYLEHFYHHLFMSDHAIVELIDELGISDHLDWIDSNVGFFAHGKIYPLPVPRTSFGLVSCVPSTGYELGSLPSTSSAYQRLRHVEQI